MGGLYLSGLGTAGAECKPLEIEKLLWHTPHYGCPEPSKAENTCGDSGDLYCRHWVCETLTWEPTGGQDPYIRLHQHTTPRPEQCFPPGSCNPVTITVLSRYGPGWTTGKTWGLGLHMAGRDLGTLFTIQKVQAKLSINPIRPNWIINPRPPAPLTVGPITSNPLAPTDSPKPGDILTNLPRKKLALPQQHTL